MSYITKETIQNLEETTQSHWIIKESTLGGRGLFSRQAIKKGDLIFTNKPLVVGPRADCVRLNYCSICYKIGDSCVPCEKCSSIICSKECKTSQEHEAECNFIKDNWKPKADSDKYSGVIKQVQIYLRFLLLSERQKLILSTLQACSNKCKIEELDQLYSKYIIPDEQVLFMKLVYSILKINSFRISNNSQAKKVPLRGLYLLSAYLNHSCVPNTRNIFREDYSMAIYATKDIKKGEEILTCYTGLLWCTQARNCQLYITKQFWCKCERCEDRTEMGTNLSALKCLNKECVGVLLPMSPLEPKLEWLCDNCNCKTSASKISTIQSVLGSLVGTLDLDDKFNLDAPVLARLANFIPYSNHIFIDIRLRLALRLGFTGALKLNGI